MGLEPLAGDDPRYVGGFRLLFRLGAGGMGRVYLGRSPSGRMVALKTVHPVLAGAPGFRERFAREVRACARVSGIGTVPLVAAGPQEPVPWLASAYVPGPSLAEAVAEHGPLPEASLWRLVAGLAEALVEVHAHGLVHRDLKPSNVLLASDRPRLIDFGIARAADETAMTGTGVAVGTPGYMSPEQAQGRELDARSDVFSLGALLVFAATGHGPFGSGSAPLLLYRVVHDEPDLAGVPEPLATLVKECLAKEPARRPAPNQLAVRAARFGTGADWLPAPVARAIARRAEELLNLETMAAPGEGPPSYTPTQVDPPGAQGFAPGYGTTRSGFPPGYGQTPPGSPPGDRPVRPGFPSGYGTADRGSSPGHGPVPPAQRGWSAQAWQAAPRQPARIPPWVRGSPVSWPLLALVTLAPAYLIPRGRVRDNLRSPDPDRLETMDTNFVAWAAHDPWHGPLTSAAVLLCLVLAVWRPFLRISPPAAVRVWAAGTGVLWLLVAAVAVLVSLVSFAAVEAGSLNVELVPVMWLWFSSLVIAPISLVAGGIRLVRALAGGLSGTGARPGRRP